MANTSRIISIKRTGGSIYGTGCKSIVVLSMAQFTGRTCCPSVVTIGANPTHIGVQHT